ncbi:CD74 molecule, major histocompatibility complex, class II invariant chain b isoform X2 [Myripristis murdjan]|uniref:CD74 molecule, major histocompatibility complex, class II invariant chain b isoform X2 n=1 Tax=Myripristis murdjan TaxID=586833 RepID=UPI00117642BD|nr:insulin-like growth factor-binding protein 2 isoform X2 [Myripristis murdjan]
MSDPQGSTEPLIRAPSHTAVAVGEQAGRSSTRAYKVAGLTLLACVLIAGQALVAYFVLSQRGDIQSLKDQNNNLRDELKKGSSAAVPMQAHRPMSIMPMLTDDFTEEEASTETPGKKAASQQDTECQLQAAGLKPMQLPSFRPACDEQGRFRAQQCWMDQCWCVDPATGTQITGSLRHGPVRCAAGIRPAAATGRLAKMLTVPDMLQLDE